MSSLLNFFFSDISYQQVFLNDIKNVRNYLDNINFYSSKLKLESIYVHIIINNVLLFVRICIFVHTECTYIVNN